MSKLFRLLFAVVLVVAGLTAAFAPSAVARGGHGVCEVNYLKVTGTGSLAHPCGFHIPHGSDDPAQRITALQYKCMSYHAKDHSGIVFCFANGVGNRYIVQPIGTDDSKNYFWGWLTLVRCLDKHGLNVRCGYLHITIVEHDGHNDYQRKVLCGKGTGSSCPAGGFNYTQNVDSMNPISPLCVESKQWHVGGGWTDDSAQRLQTVHVSWVSAWIGHTYVSSKGTPVGPRASAYWKAYDKAT